MRSKILEAKDLELYKRLLRILAEYIKAAPCTGVDRLFDSALEQGKKVMPKDKKALAILDLILQEKSVGDSVQKLLNMRFSTLSPSEQPLMKVGRKHEVAAWSRGNMVSDRVKDLLDWEGKGAGKWADVDGKPITLIDISEAKNEAEKGVVEQFKLKSDISLNDIVRAAGFGKTVRKNLPSHITKDDLIQILGEPNQGSRSGIAKYDEWYADFDNKPIMVSWQGPIDKTIYGTQPPAKWGADIRKVKPLGFVVAPDEETLDGFFDYIELEMSARK